MNFDRRPPILTYEATRRTFLKGIGATAAIMGAAPLAWAKGKTGLHGLSAFGDLKYAADFKHFDYVNPKAPRGGKFRFIPGGWGYNQNPQTFNTLNGYANKGDGPMGVEICYDSLVAGTADEPDSVYGLVAKTIDVSDDGNTYTFHMREEARFSDGSPIRAADVAWSVETLIDPKQAWPTISQSLNDLVKVEAVDDLTVAFTFNGKQSLFAPFTAASQPIFSKAFYEGREFGASSMDVPPASSAYKIARFKPGTFIEYDRMDDYWGKDLPINVGQANFDTVRIEFFRDDAIALQAFSKGDLDFRLEFTAKNWATQYEFDAIKTGKVIKTTLPGEKAATLQAFFFNTRRKQFADPLTREALGLAFDYEWINREFFFGAYTRSNSYFATATYEAKGKPNEKELALLEPFRDDISPRVFDEAIMSPISDGSGRDRNQLRKAIQLLKKAGWERKGGIQTKPDGTKLSLEFMTRSRNFERILAPFVQNLKAIGVDAKIRAVDTTQYSKRLRTYDFDVVGLARRFSPTPLQGFRPAFSSRSADLVGSSNYAGIKMKAVDALIDAVEASKNREDLEAAASALDRVLRAHFFTIPNWHLGQHRLAYWDRLGFPDVPKPDYGFPYLSTWWYDEEKAAKL